MKKSTDIFNVEVSKKLEKVIEEIFPETRKIEYLPINSKVKISNPKYTEENGNLNVEYEIIVNLNEKTRIYSLIKQKNKNNLNETVDFFANYDSDTSISNLLEELKYCPPTNFLRQC